MLPSSGYFKPITCPFFDMGFCERPHCHFKHRKVEPNLHTADVIKVKPNLHTSDDVEVACKSEYIEEDTKEDVKVTILYFYERLGYS